MRTRLTAATITAAALLALTGCSSDTNANPTACKAAMSKQLSDAPAADGKAKPGTRPAACNGVDDKTVQRIAAELVTDQASKAAEDTIESATPTTAQVSDECRTWLKAELLDNSDDIDAAAGSAVCGDLTDAEMDQAIADVTEELTTP